MNAFHKARHFGEKSSQVMVLLVFALVVLILFLGLAIDLGFAYLTKANLSKAVDSATLMGALNLGRGTDVATMLATNMFYENYRMSSRDFTNPVVNVTFTNDTQGTTYINVTASAQIRTFFVGILPQWKTFTVGTTAQGMRSRAIICLVLDRSTSMKTYLLGHQPAAAAMPGAVTNFLSYFDNTRDEFALVTFASNVSVDVQMPTALPPQPFKSTVRSAVLSIFPSKVGGLTFASGGLATGLVQIAHAPVNPPENVLKAAVFFTDGIADLCQEEGSGSYDEAQAEYCALQVANAMRANHIIVYSIGFGDKINTNFLLQIANDTKAPGYVKTAYDGKALFAPDTSRMGAVFDSVGREIALRLTR